VVQSVAELLLCPSLTHLDLSSSKLQPEAYTALVKALAKNSTVRGAASG
jgi:hypothetical protein